MCTEEFMELSEAEPKLRKGSWRGGGVDPLRNEQTQNHWDSLRKGVQGTGEVEWKIVTLWICSMAHKGPDSNHMRFEHSGQKQTPLLGLKAQIQARLMGLTK